MHLLIFPFHLGSSPHSFSLQTLLYHLPEHLHPRHRVKLFHSMPNCTLTPLKVAKKRCQRKKTQFRLPLHLPLFTSRHFCGCLPHQAKANHPHSHQAHLGRLKTHPLTSSLFADQFGLRNKAGMLHLGASLQAVHLYASAECLEA